MMGVEVDGQQVEPRWIVEGAELFNVMRHIERGELSAELGYVKLTMNSAVDESSLPDEFVPDYG